MSVVTVAELAQQLNRAAPAAGSADETELQLYVDAAEAHVTKECGPLVSASRTYRVYPSGTNLVLSGTRLTAVTSVTDPDGNVVTVDPDDVNLLAGIVNVRDWGSHSGPWSVVASGGPVTIRPDLKLAVLIIAAHLYETQRTTQPGRPGFGGGEVPPGASPGYAIPNRAAELMRPHRIVAFA